MNAKYLAPPLLRGGGLVCGSKGRDGGILHTQTFLNVESATRVECSRHLYLPR
jgi:hypothetical protein